jgi:hypothetical protein
VHLERPDFQSAADLRTQLSSTPPEIRGTAYRARSE